MKKLFIVLAFAGIASTSFAQEEATEKYSVATNSFWSNWFIQAGGTWSAWYSAGEHGLDLKRSPFSKFRSNPGVSIAIGKWFTPGLGLRLKGQGIWGKTIHSEDNVNSKNRYWSVNGQALFNLSNMFFGYNPKRVWNFIPFAGAGMGRSMTHNLYAMDLSVGILNQFYVSRKVAINFEVGFNRFEADIDGTDEIHVPKRGWESHTNQFYAELGLTFNLGKATWNKVPDVDAINAAHAAALADLNAKLRAAQDENARLRDELAKKPKEKVITKSFKDFVTTPVSVFFNLGKINVANLKDLVNVKALAKYAKENNSKMLVTGYADNSTGSAKLNERLSAERANTVKNELIKMGVPEANIQTAHNGGVKILGVDSPVDFDRRATVQILEDESMKTETVTEN